MNLRTSPQSVTVARMAHTHGNKKWSKIIMEIGIERKYMGLNCLLMYNCYKIIHNFKSHILMLLIPTPLLIQEMSY